MKRLFLLVAAFAAAIPLLAADTPEPQEALTYGARFISVADAKKLYDGKKAVFCDSRITREYIMETIPGSVPCLYDEKGGKDNKLANFDPSADTWHHDKLTDKSKTLVIFCNAKSCWRSYKAAVTAVKQGYRDVYWLRDGIPGWKAQGFETESNCPL